MPSLGSLVSKQQVQVQEWRAWGWEMWLEGQPRKDVEEDQHWISIAHKPGLMET